MSGLTVTLITAALIVLSALFVIVEFALLGARRSRLEAEAEHSPSARAALRSMNELTIMLAGAQLGITACTLCNLNRNLPHVFDTRCMHTVCAHASGLALTTVESALAGFDRYVAAKGCRPNY